MISIPLWGSHARMKASDRSLSIFSLDILLGLFSRRVGGVPGPPCDLPGYVGPVVLVFERFTCVVSNDGRRCGLSPGPNK